MVNFKELTKKPIFLIKVLELVLTCTCLRCTGGQYAAVLREQPGEGEEGATGYDGVFSVELALRTQLIIYVIFLALLLIVIICYMVERPLNHVFVMVLSAVAATVFLSGAAVNFEIFINYAPAKRKTLVGAIAGLVLTIVYSIDIYLTHKLNS